MHLFCVSAFMFRLKFPLNYILPGMLAAYTSQWKRLGPVFESESNFGFGADDRCTAEALPGALRGICFKRIFRKNC